MVRTDSELPKHYPDRKGARSCVRMDDDFLLVPPPLECFQVVAFVFIYRYDLKW